MSKAFTREDDQPETPARTRRATTLPPGAKNLITTDGAQRLRDEQSRLHAARELLAANRADPAAAQPLATLDQRLLQLADSLASVVVVPPPVNPDGRVIFGATVTVRETDSSTNAYRIVGVDEVELDRGWVSWLSPVARALLNGRAGQRVRLKIPGGERILEIVSVRFA